MKTTKHWVEGLHKKAYLLFSFVTAIEARLAAIEAGICLVPLSVNDPQSQPPNYNIPNVQLPIRSASPQSTVHSPQSPHPESAHNRVYVHFNKHIRLTAHTVFPTRILRTTLVTPNRCLQPLSSISPIVSNLPKETACNLKKYQQKASSRKKYTRKCLEEIFSADELASCNLSGNAGKDKLDE